ncbi:MAG: hypothetical protein RR356_07295 [Bacteroidales bacterium]
MKKLGILFTVVMFILVACNKDSASYKYQGTYSGTYSLLYENKTKNGKVIIAQNPVSENGLLIYGVLPLDYVSTGVYQKKCSDNSIMSTVLNAIGVASETTSTVEEKIKNMVIDATMDGTTLKLTLSYTVELISGLNVETKVKVVEFNGTK